MFGYYFELSKNLADAVPEHFSVNDNMIDLPAAESEYESVEVLRGPNIKPLPQAIPLTDCIRLPCVLKVGDNIIFSKYSGTEVKVDDKDYLVVRESDILAVL